MSGGYLAAVMPTMVEPVLPEPRGPISLSVVELLAERAPLRYLTRVETSLADADPTGLDLQLALYLCYELHYRGFAGVDAGWEWNPGLLYLRGRLEDLFLEDIRRAVGEIDPETTALSELDALCVEPVSGNGPSYHLRDEGTWEQMREYFAHRSLYHLKEGDPHAWAIPRLTGQAKASFVAVEFDEFGAGKGARLHQQLFADLMAAAGLDTTYLGYLSEVPAESLAVVNLMSMFGLHRRLRGAAVGHFAATEVTSRPDPSGWCRRWSGWVRPRSARRSTANTSRRTPSTSRSCAPTSWVISSRGNRIWTSMSCSASGRSTSWKNGSPITSWRAGAPDEVHCDAVWSDPWSDPDACRSRRR